MTCRSKYICKSFYFFSCDLKQNLYLHTESLKLVHEEHHTLNPNLPGIAYGFWVYKENNQHLLWHTGHIPGHRSALIIMPEHQLVVFLNYNADSKFLNEFLSAFIRYIQFLKFYIC